MVPFQPDARPNFLNDMQIIDRHAGDSFLMLRASYVNICNGNIVAAALIHIFEQWHIAKIKHREQERKYRKANSMNEPASQLTESLYQWHTIADLERQLMGLGKREKIQEARAQLVGMGIISEHKNPNPKFAFDKTNYFIFYPEAVETYLELCRDRMAENVEPSADDVQPSAENRERSAENSRNTYTTSIDYDKDHDKQTPAADAPGGEKKPVQDPPKQKTRARKPAGAEIDHDWQRWVDRWFDHFKKLHDGLAPMFNPAQASALKKLREYLCKVATQVPGKTPDDCGYLAWCYILDNWEKLREWLQGQFDLTVVLKKINDILNSLKNATNQNRGANSGGVKPGTSQQRVDAVRNY